MIENIINRTITPIRIPIRTFDIIEKVLLLIPQVIVFLLDIVTFIEIGP